MSWRALWLALLLLAALAPATGRAGVGCAELHALWAGKFHDDYGAPGLRGDKFACPSRESMLAEAIYALYVAPGDFYEQARRRTKSIRFADEEPSGPKQLAEADGRGNITLFPRYFARGREVARAANLIHETRHNDPDDPGHVCCEHGEFEGEPGACDAVFGGDELGPLSSGYHQEYLFLARVHRDPRYTALDRGRVAARIRWLLSNQFNVVPDAVLRKWGARKAAAGDSSCH